MGMPWDRAVCNGFGVSVFEEKRHLAQRVLEMGGRQDGWDAELSSDAVDFLCALAGRLSELLWNDDKRVDVPSRANLEARQALYDVTRVSAPGVLLAIAPWTRLPAGTIGDLHRASRPKVATALVPFIGRILRTWCEDELLVDIGKRA
jgi:hypothetical protein